MNHTRNLVLQCCPSRHGSGPSLVGADCLTLLNRFCVNRSSVPKVGTLFGMLWEANGSCSFENPRDHLRGSALRSLRSLARAVVVLLGHGLGRTCGKPREADFLVGAIGRE